MSVVRTSVTQNAGLNKLKLIYLYKVDGADPYLHTK